MPALPPIVPNLDRENVDWETDSGGTTDLYLKVDEGIAGAVDTNDYIRGPVGTPGIALTLDLSAFPADFTFINTLAIQARYAQTGHVDDVIGLQFWLVNEFDTVITDTVSITDITNPVFANSAVLPLTPNGIGVGQTLAQWNGSALIVKQTYTVTSVNDNARALVSAVEITGTYNVGPALRGVARSNLRLR